MYVPLPPDGVLPVNAAGVLPVHIVCAVFTVFPPIIELTVISIAAETSEAHGADVTVLLYHVVAVNEPGI